MFMITYLLLRSYYNLKIKSQPLIFLFQAIESKIQLFYSGDNKTFKIFFTN